MSSINGDNDGDEELQDPLPPRPLQLAAALPNAAKRKKAKEALEALGHAPEAAAAIARALESPETFLEQLKYPTKVGVHGGSLSYVTCRVRNGAALPLPTNPRVATIVQYPAGGGGGGGVEALSTRADPNGSPHLVVTATGKSALENVFERTTEVIREENNLTDTVRSQGVLLPVTLIPITFEHGDAQPDITVVCTLDGSSRMTAALATWDLQGKDVLYGLTHDGALEAKIEEVRSSADKDERDLTDEETWALRNQTIPAQVVIGFEVFDDRYDFRDIVDAYLGLIHVEPPRPWGEAASQDARADVTVDELERLGRVTPIEARYLRGLLTPAEASEAGLSPDLDTRAAKVIHVVTDRTNSNAINNALRRLGMDRPNQEVRREVATELAIRPYRRSLPADAVRRGPRLALPQAILNLRPDSWNVTDREPEVLRDTALAELEAGEPGPAAKELAVRGVFWLTRYSALQKSSRLDRRFADQLLSDVFHTPRGVHLLYQAVVDGRAGQQPRKVRVGGEVETPFNPQVIATVDDPWLRETFPMGEASGDDGDGTGEGGEDHGPDAEEQLRTALLNVRDEASSLRSRVDALEEIMDDDGNVIVRSTGAPPDLATDVSDALRVASDRMLQLKTIWEMSNRDTA